MTFGILDFPSSISTDDFVFALEHILEQDALVISHKQDHLPREAEILILADYIEPHSYPILEALEKWKDSGRKLLAIGNGVQSLTEWGWLPGSLHVNKSERMVSQEVDLRASHPNSYLTNQLQPTDVLRLSVSGSYRRWLLDGHYHDLAAQGRILFRYHQGADNFVDLQCAEETTAGLCNAQGNVCGILFHPERAVDDEIGNTDGKALFLSMLQAKA